MDMANITISHAGFKCERCGHEWVPLRERRPKVCPRCKSTVWDSPAKQVSGRREDSRLDGRPEAS